MGKSQEEVAFEMLSKLKGLGVWGEANKEEILDMYADCLIATKGLRRTKGQAAAQPVAQQPVAATPAPLAAPQQVAPQQRTPVQTAPQTAPVNPVQQQQTTTRASLCSTATSGRPKVTTSYRA